MTTATEISDIDIPYKVLHFNDGVKSINIQFYLKDCETGMRAYLQDKSVDVVVTSPPYNIGVDYDGIYDDKYWKYSNKSMECDGCC